MQAMPFFSSLSRALSAATLLIALSNAQQQCYYPDGSPSTEVPCGSSGESSCCGSSSWCMDNGLCFGGGLVSRGSCTDRTWASDACTSFCREVSPSGSIPVTPCSADGSFACGLNTTSCDDESLVFSMSGSGSFVLRASQVQQLISPALESLETSITATHAAASSCPPSPSADATGLYTGGQMAGLGLGLGLPLLFAAGALVALLYKRRKPQPTNPFLDPDHGKKLRPPMRLHAHPSMRALSRDGSEAASSIYSMQTMTEGPEHMKSFQERYRAMNDKVHPVARVQAVRVELDASAESQRKPPKEEKPSPKGNFI